MQQHADLARLCGGAAIPLALLTEWTGAATLDAGPIDHAQAPIGFSAVFMRSQFLVCWAPKRSIGLERKVLTREATGLPCGTHLLSGHSQRQERRVVEEVGEQEQTRSCGLGQDEAGAPVRVSGSRPIGRSVASIPVPRPNGYTIDLDRSPGLHLRVQAQKPHDANTARRHRRP
jgi:hypothetical protein